MSFVESKLHWRSVREIIKAVRKRLKSPAKHTIKGARGARKFLGKWVDSSGRGRWPKLAAATLKHRKKRHGYYRRYGGSGYKPLRWHRGIRRSLAQKKAPGHIERVTGKDGIIFGSDYTIKDKGRKVEVIRIHHWGRGRNPRRILLPTKHIKHFFTNAAYAMVQWQKGFGRMR